MTTTGPAKLEAMKSNCQRAEIDRLLTSLRVSVTRASMGTSPRRRQGPLADLLSTL